MAQEARRKEGDAGGIRCDTKDTPDFREGINPSSYAATCNPM